MFTPNEISDFFNGTSGEHLELAYEGSKEIVLIQRKSENNLVATIPFDNRERTDSFSIDAALSAPACGVRFSKSASQYIVHITKRFQIRSVLKIALHHLNWDDVERLKRRIFTPLSGSPKTN